MTRNLTLQQSYDLDLKVMFAKQRIEEFYYKMYGKVYISFSGGKDSTVLLHLIRSLFPDVPAVFVDTGLEYPEIREFVKTVENVIWVKPEIRFDKVIEKYGYPVISKEQSRYISELQRGTTEYTTKKRLHGKNNTRVGMISKKWQYLINSDFKISHKCCDIMKKKPLHIYEKQTKNKPFIGTMAEESGLRRQSWMKYGCNTFTEGKETSKPLSIWKSSDIWEYIKKYNLTYSKIYDMGEKRTGCMFCMFGVHLEKEPNRFQRMSITHPKQYEYCMNKLQLKNILEYLNVKY